MQRHYKTSINKIITNLILRQKLKKNKYQKRQLQVVKCEKSSRKLLQNH